MTKRLLALVLVCILAIPIFAVPASATMVNGDYGNFESHSDYWEWDNHINIYNITNLLGILIDDVMTDLIGAVEDVSYWVQENTNRVMIAFTDYVLEPLGAINSNIVAFASNVKLYFEAQTAEVSSWLEAQFNLFDGFVDEVFFPFWEDWSSTVENYLTNNVGWLYEIAVNTKLLLNGSYNQNQEAEDFENQVSTESTEFQENMEAIDEWTHPDYESEFDPSVNEITGGEDIGEYTYILGEIFNSTYLPPTLLFMAFSFSAISFVVFGKR